MRLRRGAVALAKAAMATAVVVAMVAGTARVARATPYIDPWNGGMVFVGPTSAHVSAIYWNPAAIGVMRGAHVWVSSHAAVSHVGIDRASIDPATGEPGSGESFPETSAMVIRPGGFLGATYDFGQNKIAAGIALHLPYRDEQPSKPDDQLRYHTRGGYLRSYMASFAVSYRVRGDLLVGGGASLLFTRGLWRFAVDRNLET